MAALAPPAPDPEVTATAHRRQVSRHEKRRILARRGPRYPRRRARGAGAPRRQLLLTAGHGAYAPRSAALIKENERRRRTLAPAQTLSAVPKTLCTLRGWPTAEAPEETIVMRALHPLAPASRLAPAGSDCTPQPGWDLSPRRPGGTACWRSPGSPASDAISASLPRTRTRHGGHGSPPRAGAGTSRTSTARSPGPALPGPCSSISSVAPGSAG